MIRIAAICTLTLLLVGCAAHVNHPGTANAFDSNTYDTLMVTDSVIQSTKTAYLANQFPASIAPQVKTALNDLIAAYDAADLLYCGNPIQGPSSAALVCAPTSYHAMAMAGTATPAQQTAVAAAVSTVNSKTTALTAAKGGK
jgi:hypothetical protein